MTQRYKRGALYRFHPLTILIYYIVGFVALALSSHPVISIGVCVIYLVSDMVMRGVRTTIKNFFLVITPGIICIIINPLVNHRGPNDVFMIGSVRITMEAILYGCSVGLFIVCMLMLFSSMHKELNEEKIMTLLSGRYPTFALLLSMLLRYIPQIISDAKKLVRYHGYGVGTFFALFSKSIEDGIIKGSSMKLRGYGADDIKRTGFYKKSMLRADIILLFICLLSLVMFIWIYMSDIMSARFFPTIYISDVNIWVLILYLIYFSIPLIVWGEESVSWYMSMQKIIDTDMQKIKNGR